MITLRLNLRWPTNAVVEVCGVSLPRRSRGVCVEGTLDVKGMFDNSHRVPDVDRYHVEGEPRQLTCHTSSDITGSEYTDRRPRPPSTSVENIVVLLESPHKDEYSKSGTLCPIAPAQGETGKNISHYLERYLNNPPSHCEYIRSNSVGSHVIICNPVQFQISLHAARLKLTPAYEARVWEKLWNITEVKDCFLRRLLYYCPHIIINACTKKGRGVDGLKGIVRRFLEEKSNCFPRPCHVYETAHPASKKFKDRSDFCYRTCLGPATTTAHSGESDH